MRLKFDRHLHSLSSIYRSLCLALFLVHNSHAADDTGRYLTMGLGNQSCKSFLSENDEGASYYLSWLAGYMTAYNRLEDDTYSILGKSKTVDNIESWLRDYCTVNGNQTFEEAARNLLRNLKYFRVKQKP